MQDPHKITFAIIIPNQVLLGIGAPLDSLVRVLGGICGKQTTAQEARGSFLGRAVYHKHHERRAGAGAAVNTAATHHHHHQACHPLVRHSF